MTALVARWLPAGLAAGGGALATRRLMRMRSAVASVEHELRGPLAAVRLGVDLGLRNGGLSAGQLRAIRTELARTELALDDLSRATHGLPPVTAMTEVDVPRVVGSSVQAWRPAAHARGVTLDFAADPCCQPLLGDPVRLAQATGNLIANAIEHGGSRVQVTAVNAPAGIRVVVSDDGPGLPRGLLAGDRRLTRVRAVPRRRRRHGRGRRRSGARGQGLSIVAGVAVAHGGRLRRGGQAGASLVIELPAAPRA